MIICHFSDWHGNTTQLPKADLYVCTGDMFPNFPLITFQVDKWSRDGLRQWRANMHILGDNTPRPGGYYMDRKISPADETRLQRRWIKEVLGSYRKLFGTPDAPVVCVRGNHDFTDLSEAFGGDVWEVGVDPTQTVERCGLKVGGCRGINYIGGEWSDEMHDADWEEIVKQMPTDLELLITHAPPAGMMDSYPGQFAEHWGSRALNSYVNQRMYVWGKLKAHLFGHIHEAHGSRKEAEIIFSNAATTHIVYEL